MSLTLLYRGKNVRFAMKLSKLRWLSAITVFALFSGMTVHLLLTQNDKPAFAEISVTDQFVDKAPAAGIATQYTDNQVTALTVKLAELQSQVLRLNALGDRLASEANIPEKEFNFEELPPSGGPLHDAIQVSGITFEQLVREVDEFDKQLQYEEKQLQLLESLTLGHHIDKSSYLSGRPITSGWLSSYYGVRKDPFHGRPAMHKGVDFAGKEDAPIIATASGVVTWAEERYGYGQLIEINHGAGFKTRYGHNKTILVNVGDVVEKGQVIARMGSTGRSTGPHVHYEILRNNAQINPIKYVYRKAK